MKKKEMQVRVGTTGEMITLNKRSFWSEVFSHWQLYVVLAVPLVLVVIFNYAPMYGIIIAFKDFSAKRGIMDSVWVGMKHFEKFFSNTKSMNIIANTLILSFYSLIASVPIPIILAIMLNETKNRRFKKTVQLMTYAPYFISTVVIVSMLMQFTDVRIGIINKIIGLFGMNEINFMGKSEWFRHLYVWSGVWQGAGYGAVIYIAALSGIPNELYEAATIDGANKWRRIWSIDLPMLLPTVSIMLILNLGQIMNVGFEKVYLMQNAANASVSEVISTYVYKIGLVQNNMSFSTAINLFNSVVNLVLVVVVNAVSNKLSNTSLF